MREPHTHGLSIFPTKADTLKGTSNFVGHQFSSEDFLLQCQIHSLVKGSSSWELSFIIREEGKRCISRLARHLEVQERSVINNNKAAICGLGPTLPSQASPGDLVVEPSGGAEVAPFSRCSW